MKGVVKEEGAGVAGGCPWAAAEGSAQSDQDGCSGGARGGPPSPLEAFVCSPFLGDFL